MTEVYGDNPGILIDATRNLTNGNLGALPLLLTGGNPRPPNIPLERIYPMNVPSRSSNVRAFDPNLRLPFAMSGTLGIQRDIRQAHLGGGALHSHHEFRTRRSGTSPVR